jgi:methyltransferase (TIGR00027 family)
MAAAEGRPYRLGVVNPVSHVSDTARWVAMYRALESERPDALFRDPHARTLAGPQGEAILRHLKARHFAWPMIVRTAVMDEIILRTVADERLDAVVNLAAGLDARPYRLPLPASLHWVEIDFADMLEYKKPLLAAEQPVCRLTLQPADLTDAGARAEALATALDTARRALIISEGLLVYLTDEQVAALARDLHARPSALRWLTDLATPRLLEMLRRRWGKQLMAGNSPMRFAPAEGTAWFARHGWDELQFRSTWDEAFRLNRTMRFARLFQFLSRFASEERREEGRRMSGIVLFGRRD